ncbi:hypothetical protein [Streptomyces sp. NPDC093018]|uniref:hypothetical protein n=1 Tax=Streptomyces sp. NPDC093018 TaxID=3155067 RepID=UPI003444D172
MIEKLSQSRRSAFINLWKQHGNSFADVQAVEDAHVTDVEDGQRYVANRRIEDLCPGGLVFRLLLCGANGSLPV